MKARVKRRQQSRKTTIADKNSEPRKTDLFKLQPAPASYLDGSVTVSANMRVLLPEDKI